MCKVEYEKWKTRLITCLLKRSRTKAFVPIRLQPTAVSRVGRVDKLRRTRCHCNFTLPRRQGIAMSSEEEVFDFDNISAGDSDSDGYVPTTKKKVGYRYSLLSTFLTTRPNAGTSETT